MHPRSDMSSDPGTVAWLQAFWAERFQTASLSCWDLVGEVVGCSRVYCCLIELSGLKSLGSAEELAKPLGSAMQEVSLIGCCSRTHVAPSESVKSSESGGAVKKVEAGGGYYIREKDLRKIHRAACSGNVREVQRLLLLRPGRLNDRDRRDR